MEWNRDMCGWWNGIGTGMSGGMEQGHAWVMDGGRDGGGME